MVDTTQDLFLGHIMDTYGGQSGSPIWDTNLRVGWTIEEPAGVHLCMLPASTLRTGDHGGHSFRLCCLNKHAVRFSHMVMGSIPIFGAADLCCARLWSGRRLDCQPWCRHISRRPEQHLAMGRVDSRKISSLVARLRSDTRPCLQAPRRPAPNRYSPCSTGLWM